MNLCRCGHTTEREKHPDGGPCGAYLCECDGFADVWDSKSLHPGATITPPIELAPGVRKYDGEVWIGYPETHTARLAAGQ